MKRSLKNRENLKMRPKKKPEMLLMLQEMLLMPREMLKSLLLNQ